MPRVGLTLTADHALTVVAPHGLDDLFGLRVRHTGKRWLEQWLRLSVVVLRGGMGRGGIAV